MRMHSWRPGPRAGFSLIEMLIVITIMGLMLAVVMPNLREGLVMRDLQSARSALANMYARARVNALQTRKSSTVHFSTTQVWVTAPLGAGVDTVGAVIDLTSAYGVSVDASAGSITVLPTGLANLGSTVTVKVTRSGKSDSVMVSGYGRLQ